MVKMSITLTVRVKNQPKLLDDHILKLFSFSFIASGKATPIKISTRINAKDTKKTTLFATKSLFLTCFDINISVL